MAISAFPHPRIWRRLMVGALAGASVIVGGGYLFVQGIAESAIAGDNDTVVAQSSPSVLLQDDLSAAPLGSALSIYVKSKWEATVSSSTMSRASVQAEGENRFIRIRYPAGKIGATASGASWRAHLPASEDVSAEYRVRFDADFDWTEGGKLPGLTGGNSPTGGKSALDGFSARYMWKPDGGLILYLYHSEQSGRYGESFDLGQHLERGEWHTLKQHVTLNTPGEADGVLRVWVDGELVLDRADMRWRLAGSTWSIDSFYFSTFHGGSDDSYRPARENYIDFDDVAVSIEPGAGSE